MEAVNSVNVPSTAGGSGLVETSNIFEEEKKLGNQTEKDEDPPKKKMKCDSADMDDPRAERLEERLNGILCCTVCLALPLNSVLQCNNGHLMCSGCLAHLLADARLKDETATCPNCRIEISKTLCCRNLAVEKAVSELPTQCRFCNGNLPRHLLEQHERDLCEERMTGCKYRDIGCPWKGPFHEAEIHADWCSVPSKKAGEVLPHLQQTMKALKSEIDLCKSVFELLSMERIAFNELQLKPYRTDEYIHKLYYETSRFSALNQQWVIKARVNNNERDPVLSASRSLSYQLVMKGKTSTPVSTQFLFLKGPFGDFAIKPEIHNFEFTNDNSESGYFSIAFTSGDCNKLIALKAIYFRFIMFEVEK